MNPPFEKTVIIHSNAVNVWSTLTDLKGMKQSAGEEEMELEIKTDWKVNHPIVISGFHHLKFENRGIVLQFEPGTILHYTHLSSLSRLEDKAENYTSIKFELKPVQDHTALKLTIENFPSQAIYKHLCFYWRTTIEKIKLFAEQQVELVK